MIGYRTGGMVCCGKNEGGEIRLEGGEEGDLSKPIELIGQKRSISGRRGVFILPS